MTDAKRVAYEVEAPLAERLGELSRLIPEAIIEDGVDFGKLRAALGADVDNQPERHALCWAGSREAIQLIQGASRAH